MRNPKNISLDLFFVALAISAISNLNKILLSDPFRLPSDKSKYFQEKALLQSVRIKAKKE